MTKLLTIRAAIKELSISTGFYSQARALYRLFSKAQLTKLQQDLSFYSKLLKPDSLCFDVGANIGEKTEALLKAGARVVAFEPQPDCMRELQARCSQYGSKLSTCEGVLGAAPGEVVLYIREQNYITSLHQDWEGEVKTCIPVPMTTLDQAIAQYGKPSYCKLDVEGWELEVLRGLTQSIPLISLEYHLRERELETAYACIEYLSQFGKLSINVTPAENLLFTFPRWLSSTEFFKLFPGDFYGREGYSYGDIWIQVESSQF